MCCHTLCDYVSKFIWYILTFIKYTVQWLHIGYLRLILFESKFKFTMNNFSSNPNPNPNPNPSSNLGPGLSSSSSSSSRLNLYKDVITPPYNEMRINTRECKIQLPKKRKCPRLSVKDCGPKRRLVYPPKVTECTVLIVTVDIPTEECVTMLNNVTVMQVVDDKVFCVNVNHINIMFITLDNLNCVTDFSAVRRVIIVFRNESILSSCVVKMTTTTTAEVAGGHVMHQRDSIVELLRYTCNSMYIKLCSDVVSRHELHTLVQMELSPLEPYKENIAIHYSYYNPTSLH